MSPVVRLADAPATRRGSRLEACSAAPRTDLHLRNYDDRPYTVEVVARDDGVVASRTHTLDPGELRAERALLDPGTYEVTATATGGTRATATAAAGTRATATCRVGVDPADTVCVEVGNHVVAVSQGVA